LLSWTYHQHGQIAGNIIALQILSGLKDDDAMKIEVANWFKVELDRELVALLVGLAAGLLQ
jgi:hypothetical protein